MNHRIRPSLVDLPHLLERAFSFGRSVVRDDQPLVFEPPSVVIWSTDLAIRAFETGMLLSFYAGELCELELQSRMAQWPIVVDAINNITWEGEAREVAMSAAKWAAKNKKGLPTGVSTQARRLIFAACTARLARNRRQSKHFHGSSPAKSHEPAAADAPSGDSAASEGDEAKKRTVDRLRNVWPDIFEIIRPRKGMLLLCFLTMVVNRVSGLALPLSSKYLIDSVLDSAECERA